MGAYTALWQVVALLLLFASCCLAQCEEDHFWDGGAARCTPCTRCSGPGREVTLRPCEGHRDTLCGSLKDLNIDWSSFSHAHHSGLRLPKGWQEELSAHSTHNDKLVFDDDFILPEDAGSTKPRKPKKGKSRSRKLQRLHGIEDDDDYADDVGSGAGVLDDERLLQSLPGARSSSTTSTTPTPPPSLVEDLVVPEDAGVEPYAEGDGDVSMRAAFTPVERLVWDWQAGVLVAAVCACVLFFVVAAVYAYQHVWHFRVLRKRLNADVEDISARLGLMSGMGHEHFQEPTTPPLGHHMQTRCQKMNEYSVPRKSKV